MKKSLEQFIAGIKNRAAVLRRHGLLLHDPDSFARYTPNKKKEKAPGQVYYGFKKKDK